MNKRFVLAAGLVLAVTRLEAASCVQDSVRDPNGNDYIRLLGTPGKQTAVVNIAAASTLVSLDCNGDGDFADPGEINGVDLGPVRGVDLQLGGSDTITVNLASNLTAADSRTIKVLLGPGTNVLNLGSTGAYALDPNAFYTVEINGGAGIDKATLDFSQVNDAGSISVRADLGAGSDGMVVKAPLVNFQAFFAVDVALGLGNNSFTFTDGRCQSQSTERVDVQGDAGADNVTFNFGQLSDALKLLRVDLGAGNDTFTANFDLASFSLFGNQPLHLTVNGGAGNDTIRVGRNGTIGPAFAGNVVELDLDGGPGNDTINVDFGGGGFDFAGVGGERLRIDGGNGLDTISATLDSTTNSTASHDVSISGGPLADKISFTQNTSGSGTHRWFGGAALIDGSFGAPDTCTLAGNVAANAHKRNCEL
jgi:hypothetical protein